MRRQPMLLGILAALTLIGCEANEDPSGAKPLPSNTALADEIERQVNARAPEHDLAQYVRLYTRGSESNIEATYLAAQMGGLPTKWEGGRSYWVASTDVPMVLDGGCAVINVLYHEPTNTLVSVHCNGDA